MGRVAAHASEDAAIDDCIQRTLDGRFVAFELKGDCIDCGPKRFGVFRVATPPQPPPPPTRSRISYPLTFVHR